MKYKFAGSIDEFREWLKKEVVNKLPSDEPLDGDATDKLADEFKQTLNEFYANN